ncbi:MAG TPA: MlaE family lipid ABC transporter permease subunit [Planctomycetota bacterium]|jgi:phospholipid/cholesterol/gamma-HCH transport system permease protein|nr:MlaE family lipid ABC transporter permease subunit [Planctomycetota bacterium]
MVLEVSRSDGAARVRVAGALDRTVRERVRPLVASLLEEGAREVRIDLGELERFDSVALVDLLEAIRAGRDRGVPVRLVRVPRALSETLSLVPAEAWLRAPPPPPPRSPLERLGDAATPLLELLRRDFLLLVEVFDSAVVGPFRGERPRGDRFVREVSSVGVDALPIVVVISLLLGVILAMQAAAQLRQFGASIYVANLVAVSLTREIGPLLTAILVAGRSGSASAAELGTMVVSEEIDALRQIGLHPVRFLVVPKVLGLALAVPCLTLFADAVGILGGTAFAAASLELPASLYLEQTRLALVASDITSGLVKGAVFGTLTGTIACGEGLGVSGGPDGVGRATTRSVVVSIFAIILADAFFTALFHGR